MISKPSPSQSEPVKKAAGDRIVGCFKQLHRDVRRTVNQLVDSIPVAGWGLDDLGGGQPRVRLTSTLNANQITTTAITRRISLVMVIGVDRLSGIGKRANVAGTSRLVPQP